MHLRRFYEQLVHFSGVLRTKCTIPLLKYIFWSNAVFTLVAIALIISAIRGFLFNKAYIKINKYYENIYIGLLYFGLFLGIILYFFIDGANEARQKTFEEMQKDHRSQFWAIEHFSVMIFALLIAQIGKLFTSKAIDDRQKYRYALFYYGSASCVVFVSMVIYLYHKMG